MTTALANDARQRFLAPARDPVLFVLGGLGLLALILPPPNYTLQWHWLLGKAALEEFVTRLLFQDFLLRFAPMRRAIGPVTGANATASLAFAAMHLVQHNPIQAMLVFFPALVFGYAWDRWRTLWPCVALHFTYNWLLFHNHDLLALF